MRFHDLKQYMEDDIQNCLPAVMLWGTRCTYLLLQKNLIGWAVKYLRGNLEYLISISTLRLDPEWAVFTAFHTISLMNRMKSFKSTWCNRCKVWHIFMNSVFEFFPGWLVLYSCWEIDLETLLLFNLETGSCLSVCDPS